MRARIRCSASSWDASSWPERHSHDGPHPLCEGGARLHALGQWAGPSNRGRGAGGHGRRVQTGDRRRTTDCEHEEPAMRIADRIEDLGTETAFAVAQAAADWSARGHEIYPFHLGDIDLPTAPHIIEAMNAAIADGKTGYCPGPGIPQLREALAAEIGGQRGMSLSAD